MKGTKAVSHISTGRAPRKGPPGQPHGSMGKPLASVDNTYGSAKVHGGMAGGPSPVKMPRVHTQAEYIQESAAGYGKKKR